jgi:hypothetical protein
MALPDREPVEAELLVEHGVLNHLAEAFGLAWCLAGQRVGTVGDQVVADELGHVPSLADPGGGDLSWAPVSSARFITEVSEYVGRSTRH